MNAIDRHILCGSRQDKLADLLNQVANNELQTHCLYRLFLCKTDRKTSHATPLIKSALAEDHCHYDAISSCIARLSVTSSECPCVSQYCVKKTEALADLSKASILVKLCKTEAQSIALYTQICQLTLEFDYRTFDLSYRNMHENVSHLDTMKRLLDVEKINQSVLTH